MDCGGLRRWGLTALATGDLRARPRRWPGLSGGAQRLHQRATLRSDLDGGGAAELDDLSGGRPRGRTLADDSTPGCVDEMHLGER
jgi:hypothetical protein